MEQSDTKLVVPNGTLEKLRCVVCTKFLSVFPIHLSATLGPICGRCSVKHVPDAVHDTIYEAVVAEFRFPCCNVTFGCVEYLFPSELPEHEENCKDRHLKCPGSYHLNCNWYGPCTQLQDHYETSHPIYLMKQLDFEVNFINTFDENYLLLYGDEVFIFKRRADGKSKTLYCSVAYCGWNSKKSDFYYQVTLTNRSDNSKKTFDKKPAVSLDHNITEIVSAEVIECLNNPSVIVGSVEITIKDEVSKTVKHVNKPNQDMLATIECPVCFEYMVSPIYQCLGGHSICGNCKNQVTECPSCRESIKETRNFILEGVIAYLQYPCKNWDNGCTYIAEPAATKKHEKLCEFSPYECPLKDYLRCGFKSKVSDLYDHIKKEHYENILEIDTVHIPIDEEGVLDDEDGFILKHLNQIFVLHFRVRNDAVWWSIQLIGPPENATKYACEIDIIDNATKKRRFYLKGPCSTLTSKEDCFAEMPYFKVDLEQIEDFLTDTFSYHVRVLKD